MSLGRRGTRWESRINHHAAWIQPVCVTWPRDQRVVPGSVYLAVNTTLVMPEGCTRLIFLQKSPRGTTDVQLCRLPGNNESQGGQKNTLPHTLRSSCNITLRLLAPEDFRKVFVAVKTQLGSGRGRVCGAAPGLRCPEYERCRGQRVEKPRAAWLPSVSQRVGGRQSPPRAGRAAARLLRGARTGRCLGGTDSLPASHCSAPMLKLPSPKGNFP